MIIMIVIMIMRPLRRGDEAAALDATRTPADSWIPMLEVKRKKSGRAARGINYNIPLYIITYYKPYYIMYGVITL